MSEQLSIIKNYREDESLRKSFNELAKDTYGFTFEDWYKNGYWTDKYNPYSIVMDNKVVANVSVNTMAFSVNGKRETYIQLGTVMTDENYRNKGLIRAIMNEIDREYNGSVDGMYLFANTSVLEFYPKFGYKEGAQYQCSKVMPTVHRELNMVSDNPIRQVQMNNKEDWTVLKTAIEKSVRNSSVDMSNNSELVMFYITKFMQNNVYYVEEERAYVVAEMEEEELFLHHVFSDKVVHMDRVIDAFPNTIKKVIFGFTPLSTTGYDIEKISDKNTTLFVKGKGFNFFEQKRAMFPTLSHA